MVRARLSVPHARAACLLLMSVAMACVIAAPDPAATSVSIASGLVDDLGAFRRSMGIDANQTTSARSRLFRRSGIDVSHWQGRIDWARVAASGVDFAIIKATEGTTSIDPWYQRNRYRARKAGIMVTAYHVAKPGLMGRGGREARIARDSRIEAGERT